MRILNPSQSRTQLKAGSLDNVPLENPQSRKVSDGPKDNAQHKLNNWLEILGQKQ
jgi:hypothetical protein